MRRNQSKSVRVVAFCALLLALWSISTPAAAVPPLPYSPWGTVTIDGVLASPGTVVTAWIGGVQYAQTSTVAGGLYSIDVPGDDPDTPQKDGGVAGETVEFRVNGIVAPQTGSWASGVVQNINLTITTAAPTATPTATSTATASPSLTNTATVTFTPTATANITPTPTGTAIVLPTSTFTATATPTPTATLPGAPTATNTAIATATPTSTATLPGAPTATLTRTATQTATATATPSFTATLPGAPTATATATATRTATATATLPGVATATVTRTPEALRVVISKQVISPSNGQARVNEIVAFCLVIHNVGQTTITSLSVADHFPGSLEYVSSAPVGVLTGLGSVMWTNLIAQCGIIPPGGQLQILLYLRAIAPVASATNLMMVSAGDGASQVTLSESATISILADLATATATRTTTPPVSATATHTPPPGMCTILGSVTWQGRPPAPHLAWSAALTVTLGNAQYTLFTDAFGKFSLPNLPPGQYDLTVKGRHTLSMVKQGVVLSPGISVINLGVMTEGDANGDDIVDIIDFSLLRTVFGTGDPRADFNQDGIVDIIDFSLLRMNFGKIGPVIVSLE